MSQITWCAVLGEVPWLDHFHIVWNLHFEEVYGVIRVCFVISSSPQAYELGSYPILLSLMWLFFTLSWSFMVCVLLCFLPNCIDQKCSQYSEVVCKLVMHSLTNFAISPFLHISVIQYSTLTVLCIIVAQHQHFNIPVSLSIESIFLPTHLSTYLFVCFLTYLSHFHFHYAM